LPEIQSEKSRCVWSGEEKKKSRAQTKEKREEFKKTAIFRRAPNRPIAEDPSREAALKAGCWMRNAKGKKGKECPE